MQVSVVGADGSASNVELSLPVPAHCEPSFFAWGMHKAGSTLLTKLLSHYLAAIGYPYLNLPAQLFNRGIPSSAICPGAYDQIFARNGCGYIGWRNPHPLSNSKYDFAQSRHVLLVRDPRDRMVSWYYSIAHSHGEPRAGGAVQKKLLANRSRVLSLGNVNNWIASWPSELMMLNLDPAKYHALLPSQQTRVYRYEDVIFRKREFLADVVEFFRLPLEPHIVERVARRNDIRPAAANPTNHVRQVKWGNYKSELNLRALACIQSVCGPQIKAYQYNRSDSFGRKLVFAYEGAETQALFQRKLVPSAWLGLAHWLLRR